MKTPKFSSIEEKLSQFGLNHIEAEIYLYLLNKEPQTIVTISKVLNIPRTSIYDNALHLIEKGLVERIIQYKSQRLRAFPLNILQSIIDKEKTKIEELQKNLLDLEENVKHFLAPTTATQVRYYHGAQGFMQMMWNTLSAEKETIGYSEFGRIEVVGRKFTDRWYEETIKRKIVDRVITNPNPSMLSKITKNPDHKYRDQYQNTRLLPEEKLYISGDTTIYNNIFAVCYWKQGEVVGIEIENAELVKTQKSIFELLWSLAEPLSQQHFKEDLINKG